MLPVPVSVPTAGLAVTFKKRTQQHRLHAQHPGRFAGGARLVSTVPTKHLLRLQEESSYAAGWLLPAPAGSERCMVAELQRYLAKHGQVGATQACDVLVVPDTLLGHVTGDTLAQPVGSICVLSCGSSVAGGVAGGVAAARRTTLTCEQALAGGAAQTSGAPPPAKRRKSEPALLMALPVAMGGVSDGDDMDDMHSGAGRWSAQEDRNLRAAVAAVGAKHWKRISQEYLGGVRSDVQCLHRWNKCLKPGLCKGRRVVVMVVLAGLLYVFCCFFDKICFE